MEKKVTEFAKKHQLLKENTTVLLGVSGGPDSIALLYYYLSIKESWNLQLVVLSIDHQLRGTESKEDSQYVQQVCQKEGVKFISASLDVPAYMREQAVGTQVAARTMRYRYFERQMLLHQADYLALGHHGDDQVETMLMRITRTSSSASFAGIPMKRRFATGWLVRPLLCVTKQEIIMYCEEKQVSPRIDPSNEETNYTRNYFRKYIVPLIKEKNSNIHSTIQQLSKTMAEDEKYLQAEAEKMLEHVVQFCEEGKQATFQINMYKLYPLSLQRRCYHLLLNYLYNQLPENLTYVHEEIFLGLLTEDQNNAQVDFPRGLKIERSYDVLLLSFPVRKSQPASFEMTLHIPDEIVLSDGATLITSYTDTPKEENVHRFVCEVDQLSLPLQIRTRQPGDRMAWKGLAGSKKVKDVFIDAKVPRQERDRWPIITDKDNQILWLVGLRRSVQSEHTKGSLYIQLEYIRK